MQLVITIDESFLNGLQAPPKPSGIDSEFWYMFWRAYYMAYGMMPTFTNGDYVDYEEQLQFMTVQLINLGYVPQIGVDPIVVTDDDALNTSFDRTSYTDTLTDSDRTSDSGDTLTDSDTSEFVNDTDYDTDCSDSDYTVDDETEVEDQNTTYTLDETIIIV